MTDGIALCRRLFQATESSTRRISVGSAAGVTDDAFSACGACNQAKPSADDLVRPTRTTPSGPAGRAETRLSRMFLLSGLRGTILQRCPVTFTTASPRPTRIEQLLKPNPKLPRPIASFKHLVPRFFYSQPFAGRSGRIFAPVSFDNCFFVSYSSYSSDISRARAASNSRRYWSAEYFALSNRSFC